GPNLTDDKWILGGGFKNIYTVISKGGRPGKGMIAWESTVSQKERQQLASYIISIQGTTPANPKAPEGDITWSK
ncbi:MAG: cytochrome C oxidase subunit III, partial [Flavobacteriaceae bacterium]|nr:cytochrome C oxidase subunit III [Flavobacteriaceae bacterium]